MLIQATPLLSSGPEDKSPLGSELPPVTESPHDQHLKKTDTDSPHDPHVKKTVIQQGISSALCYLTITKLSFCTYTYR